MGVPHPWYSLLQLYQVAVVLGVVAAGDVTEGGCEVSTGSHWETQRARVQVRHQRINVHLHLKPSTRAHVYYEGTNVAAQMSQGE